MTDTPNKKISAGQLKQLQQLMMQKKAGGSQPQAPVGPKKFTPKWFFLSFLQTLQNNVKFIDQFIDFVVKKDSDKTNDVIKQARAPIMFGVFVLVFFVLLGSIWAAVAPLDSAAVAIGTVVSHTNKKSLNHPEGGVIKKIYINLLG